MSGQRHYPALIEGAGAFDNHWIGKLGEPETWSRCGVRENVIKRFKDHISVTRGVNPNMLTVFGTKW
jgi:hypothetical protein